MRSPLYLPLLATSTLSTILAVAILACAARSLHTFNLDQEGDVWLLPIWRDHFDTRDLQGFIGAGAFITLTSLYFLVSTLIVVNPNTIIQLVLASLSAVAALVALVLSNVLARQPTKDTLQSWTCSWIADTDAMDEGVSPGFTNTCRSTRLAFWGIIPLFLLQLALIACLVLVPIFRKRRAHVHGGAVEKGQSMDSDRQSEWGAKNANQSVRSVSH